jgi:ketosteroid isomerase-like protein
VTGDENIEIFRAGLAGFNRDGADGVVPFLHDDFEAHPFPEWPGPSIYRGHAGFRQLASEWTENFDNYSWQEERAIAVGDDVVVGLVYHQGRIKGTGIAIRQEMGVVWASRGDGKAAKADFFLTWAEALDAAGVSE